MNKVLKLVNWGLASLASREKPGSLLDATHLIANFHVQTLEDTRLSYPAQLIWKIGGEAPLPGEADGHITGDYQAAINLIHERVLEEARKREDCELYENLPAEVQALMKDPALVEGYRVPNADGNFEDSKAVEPVAETAVVEEIKSPSKLQMLLEKIRGF